jgi:hypothetical protein
MRTRSVRHAGYECDSIHSGQRTCRAGGSTWLTAPSSRRSRSQRHCWRDSFGRRRFPSVLALFAPQWSPHRSISILPSAALHARTLAQVYARTCTHPHSRTHAHPCTRTHARPQPPSGVLCCDVPHSVRATWAAAHRVPWSPHFSVDLAPRKPTRMLSGFGWAGKHQKQMIPGIVPEYYVCMSGSSLPAASPHANTHAHCTPRERKPRRLRAVSFAMCGA